MSRRQGGTQQPSEPKVKCAAPSCSVAFVPRRKDQRYHSATCRQRGARSRKQAEQVVEREAHAGKDSEHPIVTAARKELEAGDALTSLLGQIAMETANRTADRAGNYAANVKLLPVQVKEALDAARRKAGCTCECRCGEEPTAAAGPSGPAQPAVPDALARAREARDRARQAADPA